MTGVRGTGREGTSVLNVMNEGGSSASGSYLIDEIASVTVQEGCWPRR